MSRSKKSEPLLMDVDIVEKESHKRPKEEIKQKGTSSEPHPKDRESGTGRGKEMRKNGAGKNNWGNFKDDLKDYGVDEPETLEYEEENGDDNGAQTHAQPPLVLDEKNFPKLS